MFTFRHGEKIARRFPSEGEEMGTDIVKEPVGTLVEHMRKVKAVIYPTMPQFE